MPEIPTIEADPLPVRPDALPGLMTAATAGQMVPQVTHIGRGYDIHGQYAASANTKEQLFDLTERIDADDTDFPELANQYAEMNRLFGHATFTRFYCVRKKSG